MVPCARIPTRRLALLTTAATGLGVVALLAAALWTPGDLGLTLGRGAHGQAVVTWVAPNGPAWSAGVIPGDTIVAQGGIRPERLVVQARGQHLVLGLESTTPTPLDVLLAALGLGFLGLGAVVLSRSPHGAAAWAFWRLCLVVGAGLGSVPAGVHGLRGALALTFVALRLLGAALLESVGRVPTGQEPAPWERTRCRRLLLWLPAGVLLALYPICWRQPLPLFLGVQLAGLLVLAGCLGGACIRVLLALRHPAPAENERAQQAALALGLVGSFLPFLGLTLLPGVLLGHALAPPQASALPFALFLVSSGVVIVRREFLGIPSLLSRWTLHLVLHVALLAGVATVVSLVAALVPQRWGWPTSASVAGASVLTLLLVMALRSRLLQEAERFLLHDVYTTDKVLSQLSEEMDRTEAYQRGTVVVARVSEVLDLRFAWLEAAHQHWAQWHPRDPAPADLLAAVGRRVQAVLAAGPAAAEPQVEQVDDVAVFILPLCDRTGMHAVLCLGPKRSGDPFTRQDQGLLRLLCCYAARLFAPEELQEYPAEQNPSAPDTQAAPTPLTRRQLVVLVYAAQGRGNDEIAVLLKRTPKTVEGHLTHIYRALGVTNCEEAVTLAQQRGWLPSGESTSGAPPPTPSRRRRARHHTRGQT